MSFNRTQSRAVIGLLTGHNTLRRHLYLLGLQDSPLYRKCGVMEENSTHFLCECEALASLRHAHLGSFFWELNTLRTGSFKLFKHPFPGFNNFNPLNAELNPICYLLALLAHHFLHVSSVRVKSLNLRPLMSYIYGAPILDVSRSHTTTQHSR